MPMEFDLVLRGGTIVSSLGQSIADVGVRAGRIEEIGDLKGAHAKETLDAGGLHVLPGVIDTQVHFREPGLTHKEDIAHGSLAAVMGGVTTFFEMPNTDPPTTTAEALDQKLDIANRTSHANYGFFIGASRENVDVLQDLERLPGAPGVKIFAGSSTGTLLVDSEELLEQVLRHGTRPCPVHSEDEARLRERKKLAEDDPDVRRHPVIRDAEAARLSTERLIRLCEKTQRPVHILHVSTLDELPMLKDAKKRGLPITCEVTPQHLYFDASAYEKFGSLVQMNPPIRSEEHQMALWHALDEGLFDVFGSDHAPHTIEEKSKPYPQSPSGMPGVQTMLPVLLDWCSQGKLALEKVVKMACERPADLYGIKDKGRIAKGYDADLALVDLKKQFTVEKKWLKSKCGWSPFEGVELTGMPVHTIVGGTVVTKDATPTELRAGRMVQFTWKN